MDHAGEFVALGIGQIWTVDNPVVVGATVETVLLSCTVGEHFSFAVFFPRGRVWLAFWRLVEASLAAAAAVADASVAAALPFCAKARPPPLSLP